MHTRRTVVAVVALCALFASVWMLPDAAAAEEAREPARPLAEMTLGASRVDWQPTIDYERLVLTVAGPEDLYIRREFGAGETPSFSPLDVPGGRLLEGVYAYELRAVPRQNRELHERLSEGSLVQSGHLWVQEGSFVTTIPAQPSPANQGESAAEPPSLVTANSTTVPGDLIVEGHACIGADCVDASGPPLKIKELANYQIKFDALNCCIPSERVWALQANDPAGGTGDFLIRDLTAATIPLRIGANSPNNTLTTLYNGNVGLGTLTPAVRLDVKASAAGQAAQRLQSSSATGYSGIEYLDNAGNVDLFFGVDNAASTTRLNSVNNNPIVLLTNSTERMRVTSDGKVGIGTSSPAERLHAFENLDANTLLTVENPNTGVSALGGLRAKSDTAIVSFQAHGSGRTISRFGQSLGGWAEFLQVSGNGLAIGTLGATPLILGTNNSNRLHISSNGNIGIGTTSPTHPLQMASGAHVTAGGVWTNASSRDLKHDIQSLEAEEARTTLARLEPVRFRYNADPADESLGFIAEDVPALVATGDHKTLSPMDLVAVLTRVVQEQQEAIGNLQETVTSLSEKLAAMEERKENDSEPR